MRAGKLLHSACARGQPAGTQVLVCVHQRWRGHRLGRTRALPELAAREQVTDFQEEEKGAGAAPAADGAAPAKAAAAPAPAADAAAAPAVAAPAKPLEAPAAEQYTVCKACAG